MIAAKSNIVFDADYLRTNLLAFIATVEGNYAVKNELVPSDVQAALANVAEVISGGRTELSVDQLMNMTDLDPQDYGHAHLALKELSDELTMLRILILDAGVPGLDQIRYSAGDLVEVIHDVRSGLSGTFERSF